MTDLTQSNWYDAVYAGEDDGANPFARAASKRLRPPQRIYDCASAIDRALGLTPQMEKAETQCTI